MTPGTDHSSSLKAARSIQLFRYILTIFASGMLLSPVIRAATTGPQLATFVSNNVAYATVSWHDAQSNLLTRVEVSVDSRVWYSDEETVPLVRSERSGDFNQLLYMAVPEFYPSQERLFRLTSSRPRPEATTSSGTVDKTENEPIILNATDPAGSPETLSRIITVLPTKGRLFDGPDMVKEITAVNTVVTDPLFRVMLVPNDNASGADSFSYKVRRGWIESSSRYVKVSYLGENHPPVPTAQNVVTDEDTPVLFQLSGYDADGDAIIPYVRSIPVNGRIYQVAEDGATLGVEIDAPGTEVENSSYFIAYVPNPNIFGVPTADQLRYDLFDQKSFSDRITLNIAIRPVNDAPVAYPATHYGDTTISVTGVILDAYDIDSPIYGRVLTFPAKGKLYRKTISPENLITPEDPHFDAADLLYESDEPIGGDTVQYTFSYQLDDGQYTSDIVTDTIIIRELKKYPLPTGTPASVIAHMGETIQIILNGEDPDGDESRLVFRLVTAPHLGTLSFEDAAGDRQDIFRYPFTMQPSDPSVGWIVYYTPASEGSDYVEFTLQDEQGLFYHNPDGTTAIRVNIDVQPAMAAAFASPKSPSSVQMSAAPRFTSNTVSEKGCNFTFMAEPAANYVIEKSNDLLHWATAESVIQEVAPGTYNAIIQNAGNGKAFFRLKSNQL
jgi:hypothetical protein